MGNCFFEGCYRLFQPDWNEGSDLSPRFIRNKPASTGGGGDVDLSGIESDISELEKKVGGLHSTVHMVNSVRGCVNIRPALRRLDITDVCRLYRDEGASLQINPESIAWTVGSDPDNDTYYVLAGREGNNFYPSVYVIGEAGAGSRPALKDPVVAGVFRVGDGKVQGLSFCNDDVTVDGRYIYGDPPGVKIIGAAMLLGDTRGDMNIDTAGRTVTLASDAALITDAGRYTVPAGSYAWNKGNAAGYAESLYTVYAEVPEGDAPCHLTVVSAQALFVPDGTAYRIGAFYWTGTAVGGVNFGNDVKVDGAYIYDSGYNTAASFTNFPVDRSTLVVTLSASGTAFTPLGGSIKSHMTVIVKNPTSAAVTQAIPASGDWVSWDGNELAIPAGGMAEINIVKADKNYIMFKVKGS